MARPTGYRLTDLEATLDYTFTQPQLLEEALTHPSAAPARRGAVGQRRRSYQRLEFLGDRVLGLIVAHLLIERFPDDAEGALTNRQVALVRREALAEVAERLGLGRWVQASLSSAESVGASRTAILADCCEALIGALYLDGGLAAAQRFVVEHWRPLIEAGGVAPPRDAKMALQEWAQGRGMDRPVYTVVETTGPAHATVFTVEVRLSEQAPITASGSTKRAAERLAATRMLERLQEVPHD